MVPLLDACGCIFQSISRPTQSIAARDYVKTLTLLKQENNKENTERNNRDEQYVGETGGAED